MSGYYIEDPAVEEAIERHFDVQDRYFYMEQPNYIVNALEPQNPKISVKKHFESLVEGGLVFVIEEDRRVKGYVRSNLSDGRYVHGGGLFVHPLYRGKGIGRALALGLALRVRADSGAALVLDVNRENEAAARAYRAVGFRKQGAGLEVRFPHRAWA